MQKAPGGAYPHFGALPGQPVRGFVRLAAIRLPGYVRIVGSVGCEFIRVTRAVTAEFSKQSVKMVRACFLDGFKYGPHPCRKAV